MTIQLMRNSSGNDAIVQLGFDQITRAMVDAFFEEVYPCSVFGFLRKNPFYESFENGYVSRGLLLSLCSLSVKYVLPKHEEQSRRWSAEAKSHAHRDIESGQVTASTLGSLILCFHQELFNRIFGAAWMTSGVAIRLAFALRFNLTPNTAPPGTLPMAWADGESRRRMMWAVYAMDIVLQCTKIFFTNPTSMR
ncbi:unnamed protein product [Clonostachys byssicola]|uniref:Xylanolytic transcriptional activator regulatory domain-containing protein n=1 Tax=Clonostachys byssicola TaxID=160290 RepID=A0A9N9UL01_9HYPO|nr:unnamed protein product [Clonostachys byssicola]